MSQVPSKTDFDFYVSCAKPLVLNLPNLKDRTLASAWIKRLAEDTKLSKELKTSYLKLLLYFLQKRKLDGPFGEHPNNFDTLTEIPKDQNVCLFETVYSSGKRSENRPFSTDFSGDLRTYVAYQDIANFGVHCYYAMSKHPVTFWDRFDETLFPTGIRPAGVTQNLPELVDEDTPAVEVKVKDEELEQRKYDFADKLQKKIRSDEKKVMFLVSPIGKRDTTEDDRIPPTWGSNLLVVKDLEESQF